MVAVLPEVLLVVAPLNVAHDDADDEERSEDDAPHRCGEGHNPREGGLRLRRGGAVKRCHEQGSGDPRSEAGRQRASMSDVMNALRAACRLRPVTTT